VITDPTPDPLASSATVASLRRTGDVVTVGEHSPPLALPRWMILVGLVVGEALMARAMTQVPSLGVLLAFALTVLGGWSILRRDLLLGLTLIAYLPGTEIIWRQSRAPIPFYVAPYLAIAIAGAAGFMVLQSISKPGRSAVFYLALLVPSVVVTISVASTTAREAVTFALVGPVTLAALVVLCSHVVVEPWFFRRLLWALVIGGVGPLVIALTAINDTLAAGGTVDFGSEANFITSGGFGPVQVSSVMGLTVLGAILLVVFERDPAPRMLAAGLAVLATIQSFLTFSRGGMFGTAIALGALAISQTRSPEGRKRVIAVVGVAFAFGYFVIVPRVDDFTEGAFRERFEDTSSGRTGLATNDLEIFKENLAFGVGPGMSKYSRLPYEQCRLRADECNNEASSHTEFTRMLSEHGLVGLGSMVVFATIVVQAVRRSGPSMSICITFLAWAVAQMFYANMRVVAIPIAFGLAFVRVERGPPIGEPLEELEARFAES